MYDQTRQWSGIGTAPWADRAPSAAGRKGAHEHAARAGRRSARRVGLRLGTLCVIALLCAVSGTAVYGGPADAMHGPQPGLWLILERGVDSSGGR